MWWKNVFVTKFWAWIVKEILNSLSLLAWFCMKNQNEIWSMVGDCFWWKKVFWMIYFKKFSKFAKNWLEHDILNFKINLKNFSFEIKFSNIKYDADLILMKLLYLYYNIHTILDLFCKFWQNSPSSFWMTAVERSLRIRERKGWGKKMIFGHFAWSI